MERNSTSKNILSLPRWKRWVFASVSFMLGLIFSLTIAEIILNYQRQYIENSDNLDEGMMLYDKLLGWRMAPGWQGNHNHYDFDVEYIIDGSGFRQNNGQNSKEQKAVPNFAILGDSFTFGIGVKHLDTFAQLLNRKANNRGIFLNYGVPGYSTDQEYLLFDNIIRLLQPEHVIVVVYLANDLFDNQLEFPLQAENSKPYFILDNDNQLKQQNIPVPMKRKTPAARNNTLNKIVMGEQTIVLSSLEQYLGQLEIFRRLGLLQKQTSISQKYFDQKFEYTLRLFFALITKFQSSCQQLQCDLSIALLPGQSYVIQPDSISAQYQAYLKQKILQYFDNNIGVDLIDLATPLREAHSVSGKTVYFPNEGHLNAQGHKIVAQEIIKQLKIN